MFASLLLVLAASPDPTTAVIDLRGHTGEQVHRTLEQVLPSLATCLSSPPVPPRRGDGRRPPVVVLPATQELVLAIASSGMVAMAEVKPAGRLDGACAVALLRRLEFGRSTGTASTTLVRVPVTCDVSSCRYPWTPKP